MLETVEARAPTRIDFAGGTLDLWPLSLLLEHPVTLNAAIDLYARARVERAPQPGIEIVSRDRNAAVRAGSLAHLKDLLRDSPGELEFPMRLAAHFLEPRDAAADGAGLSSCRITTDCQAPAGSGLGGSSTLGIALATALDRFTARGVPADRLLALTRAIETQVLRVPTGEQDYYPAVLGGALALHYEVEGTRAERLTIDANTLRRRTVLLFTGVSRSSGISNWDILKRHLDGDEQVVQALHDVNRAAHDMLRAIKTADWDRAGAAMGEEWMARKRLSPKVTSPEIDALIAGSREAGALAGKVCGAGGGGCMVLWAREGRVEEVRERAAALGARVLEFSYVSEGVTVTKL